MLPLAAGARRTVRTERIGHGPVVVEPTLRRTHGPGGQRRAQVGDGCESGQHVVGSYSGRHLPDDQFQYGTTCLLGRRRAGDGSPRIDVPDAVLGAPRDDHLVNALWLGEVLPLKGEILPVEVGPDKVEELPPPNTSPTLRP